MTGVQVCNFMSLFFQGTFELTNARLKLEYLSNFMVHDVDFPRHRMRHMLRKVLSGTEDTVLRACIDMEWTLLFD